MRIKVVAESGSLGELEIWDRDKNLAITIMDIIIDKWINDIIT